jgi:hypothetical protein
MRFRTYKNTDLTVSEVGFGLWTISTGWWGNFTEGEAIALMHKAFDLASPYSMRLTRPPSPAGLFCSDRGRFVEKPSIRMSTLTARSRLWQ